MAEPIRATFRKPFTEQVAAFRLRLGNLVPTSAWDDLQHSAHDRGFMVAGAMKADLLADLGAAVDRAIAEGTGIEAFRADFRDIVTRHGWHGWTGEGTAKGEAWRTKVIYRTNMATSMAAGRWAQLVDGKFKYLIYQHSGAAHPRLDHLSWDKLVLPFDHEFWKTHYPPNGWGCGCKVRGAHTLAGARRVGGDPDKPLPDNWNSIDPKSGAPVGVGKGWDYAPGHSVARTLLPIADKLAKMPAPIGANLAHRWPDSVHNVWSDVFADFVDKTLQGPPRGRMMIIGAMKPKWVNAATGKGVMPHTAEIAVRDRDILHTFRSNKSSQLDLTWYKRLPNWLRNPDAVLLDETHSSRPALIVILNIPGSKAKLVIQLNYAVKRSGVLNVLDTGRIIRTSDIKSMMGQKITLIDGVL
ncbi:phage head morphogenesis protein [Profundibacter sp.]